MNYIKLINNCWQLVEEGILNSSTFYLYSYLLHTSNKLEWKNPFNQSNALICAILKISEPTLIRNRNILKQLNLINYKSGSTNKNTTYYLNNVSPDVSKVVSTDVSKVVSKVVRLQNKQNKTKQKEKEKKEIFSPPSLDVLKVFISENKYEVDPSQFINFYESKNWMIGSNKMKDWKAAVRTWQNRINQEKEKGCGQKEKYWNFTQVQDFMSTNRHLNQNEIFKITDKLGEDGKKLWIKI